MVRSNAREIIQEITAIFPTDAIQQAAIWLLKKVDRGTNLSRGLSKTLKQFMFIEVSTNYLLSQFCYSCHLNRFFFFMMLPRCTDVSPLVV